MILGNTRGRARAVLTGSVALVVVGLLLTGCGRARRDRDFRLPRVVEGFLFALLLTSLRAQTTPIVIANFQTQSGLDWCAMTALAAVYSAPVILLTLVRPPHIVAGLTLGAVNGLSTPGHPRPPIHPQTAHLGRE